MAQSVHYGLLKENGVEIAQDSRALAPAGLEAEMFRDRPADAVCADIEENGQRLRRIWFAHTVRPAGELPAPHNEKVSNTGHRIGGLITVGGKLRSIALTPDARVFLLGEGHHSTAGVEGFPIGRIDGSDEINIFSNREPAMQDDRPPAREDGSGEYRPPMIAPSIVPIGQEQPAHTPPSIDNLPTEPTVH